ncbi:sodium-dependent transporter [Thermococcus sp.]|uniref:sodium-dependent transporter n=1 Tax=Thermococcus sp. TaxID=35749 RepID=UPI000F1F6409|nr:sodium-dependent transporter [Thermococcus sp.]MCD6142738.1 sodium-dependent transporter [Thermococcus sp.]RLF81479.1 MAG: sodium-dependent transporter [Thermococci archaeon]
MAEREEWGSRVGFILAAMGSAIGLGNIWRFSYMTYSNGGGAFLVPYFFALLTAGIPIMILEIGIGSMTRFSAPFALGKVAGKKAEWIGWWTAIAALILNSYYMVILSWAFLYIFKSVTLAWGKDPGAYFFGNVLGLTDGPFILGGIRLPILLSFLVIVLINWFIVSRGVKGGIERACKIFLPLMWIIVLLLVIRGITLPHGLEGINWYLKPDFSKLANHKVWLDAYGQIFFTLSLGMGTIIVYGSYLRKGADVVNNSFLISLGNCGFSFLAGFAVFGTLGYVAHVLNKPFEEVVTAGIGLAFVMYPKAISLLPAGKALIGILFFFLLTIAGLSSSISLMENTVGILMDGYKLNRMKATSIVAGVTFLIGLIYTTGGGLYWLDMVDHFISYYALALVGLLETIAVTWVFGADKFREFVNSVSEIKAGSWWTVFAKYLTIAILVILLLLDIYSLATEGYGGYPGKALGIAFGYILLGMIVAYILHSKEKLDITKEVS